jgi:hypothetical protein
VGDAEIRLAGGKLNEVVRVGDTVRRPTGPWTPVVHRLLEHLRRRGFTLGPEPLGYDDRGREVLSYLPGDSVGTTMPWPDWVWDEDLLGQVGRAAAGYHRAVADFRPDGVIPWHSGAAPLADGQIVCHHDLAPYNVVVEGGRLRGIIDWDLIGPGTVRSELAFIAWQWVPLQHPLVTRYFGWDTDPDLGRRLRILLDAYGLDDRSGFIADVTARVHLNQAGIVQRAAAGDPAYQRLAEEGHVAGMDAAIDFLTEQEGALQSELD